MLTLRLLIAASVCLNYSFAAPNREAAERHERASKSVCFFNVVQRSSDEHQPRTDRTRISTNCSSSLTPLSVLASRTTNSDEATRLGYDNDLDLALSRSGMFSANTSDPSWATLFMCSHHEHELVVGWRERTYGHLRRIRGSREEICGFNDEPSHHALSKRELNKAESQLLMKLEGRLVPIGTGICRAHITNLTSLLRSEYPSTTPNVRHSHRHYISRVNLKHYFEKDEDVCEPELKRERAEDPDYYSWRTSFSTQPKMEPSCRNDLRTLLFEFARKSDIKRLDSRLTMSEMTESTRRRKESTTRRFVFKVFQVLDENADEKSLMASIGFVYDPTWNRRDLDTKYSQIMRTVSQRFFQADSHYERVYVLSLVAGIANLADCQEFIPGLKKSLYNKSRRIARSRRILPNEKHHRQRFSEEKIEALAMFATSPAVMVGLPWSGYITKKSDGSEIWIQNTLRKLIPAEFIVKYGLYLASIGRPDLMLPNSTIYHLLNEVMKATTRMPSQCVDNFVQSGESGWDDMLSLIEELFAGHHIDSFERTKWMEMIRSGRHYLRADYKSHIEDESSVPDHCSTHSLSDEATTLWRNRTHPFRSLCKHEKRHTDRCSRCDSIDALFHEMKVAVEDIRKDTDTTEEVDEVMEIFLMRIKIAKKRVMELKHHQLRTIDYAMKFIPAKHHVAQSEGFGLAGMSWHVAHLLVNLGTSMAQHTYVHFMSYEEQDSVATTLILEETMKEIRKAGIVGLHIRSDNAPNYHTGSTIASLSTIAKRVNISLYSYTFSESQSGKAAADREAARIKFHVNRYLARTSDASAWTPLEFFKAAASEPLLPSVSFYLVSHISGKKNSKTEISQIRSLGHFDYSYDPSPRIRAWRYHDIGTGILVEAAGGKEFPVNEGRLHETHRAGRLTPPPPMEWGTNLTALSYWMPYSCSKCQKKAAESDVKAEKEAQFNEDDEEEEDRSEDALFRCPVDGCVSEFILEANLNKHIDIGKHVYRTERRSMDDVAKDAFAMAIQSVDVRAESLPILIDSIDRLHQAQDPTKEKEGAEEGSALPTRAERVTLEPNVKKFLDEQYEKGRTEKKYRHAPELTEHELKTAMKDGKRRFFPQQWLLAPTISNYFRRCYEEESKKNKKKTNRAARLAGSEKEEEDDLSRIELHPVKFLYEEVITPYDAMEALIDREGLLA